MNSSELDTIERNSMDESGAPMDNPKATELAELALEALRDLEEAIRNNDRRTMDLKTEVLRVALFDILAIAKST